APPRAHDEGLAPGRVLEARLDDGAGFDGPLDLRGEPVEDIRHAVVEHEAAAEHPEIRCLIRILTRRPADRKQHDQHADARRDHACGRDLAEHAWPPPLALVRTLARISSVRLWSELLPVACLGLRPRSDTVFGNAI